MLTVVTGPPCAGKTTYVREHARPGDIRIDFDDLAQALGSPVRHGHDPAIQTVTVMARRAAIEAAVAAHRRGATVWIVDCTISAARARLYADADAVIVTLGADQAELHRRAHAERPRRWHGLINQWQPQRSVTPPGSASASRTW